MYLLIIIGASFGLASFMTYKKKQKKYLFIHNIIGSLYMSLFGTFAYFYPPIKDQFLLLLLPLVAMAIIYFFLFKANEF